MQPSEKKPQSRRRVVIMSAAGVIGLCCLVVVGGLALTYWNYAIRAGANGWTQVEADSQQYYYDVNCFSPAVCYMREGMTGYNGDSGLLKSTNGGRTWTTAAPPNLDPKVGVYCTSETTCFGTFLNRDTSIDQIYYTEDGAQNWTPVENTESLEVHAATCFGATDCFGLMKFIGADLEDVFGFSTGAGVFLTQDGGLSWEPLAPLGENLESVADQACPSADRCLAVGGVQGPIIALVPTNGDRATTVDLGADILATAANLRSIDCPSASMCYAVGLQAEDDLEGVILKSTDAGDTWVRQVSGARTHLLDVTCPAENECFVVGSAYAAGGGKNDFILRTFDGGSTWQVVADSTENPWNRILIGDFNSVSCPTEAACVAVGTHGLVLAFQD